MPPKSKTPAPITPKVRNHLFLDAQGCLILNGHRVSPMQAGSFDGFINSLGLPAKPSQIYQEVDRILACVPSDDPDTFLPYSKLTYVPESK